ncbi:MAG: MurR/RpiR family transcriptional regulator [Alphaproteobacteria bacterium]|nr:MurR/RpiR family transcriptional regulator [Alphaproteobacteria bacterium]
MSPTFEQRIAERVGQMSPAEQRVVRFFENNREEVLIASAAALAARAETSDATVVRAAKALGFAGLEDLRRTLADELRHYLSPAERLTRTLSEVGASLPTAFEATIDLHLRTLESLRRSVTIEAFEKAIDGIAGARRIVVFGLGPSAAIANYLVTQLIRFGLDAISLTNTGLLFADDLRKLRHDDLVIMLAYGRVYGELAALLDEIERQKLRSFLITDTLAGRLQQRVDLILRVARGQADMLAMHTATLGFIEALLVGVATRRPAETLASLKALNEAREKLVGKTMTLPLAG